MQKFYDTNIIPTILDIFKVDTVVVSGITDAKFIKDIFNYNAVFTKINTNDSDCIIGNPLNILPNFENYDAIFINDDSNWYTVFSELKIIKEKNNIFPLVFICNNVFPNKKRDSYINPDNIPSEFRQKYTSELPIYLNNKKIIVHDGFYHACEDNTSKNGVLTAIEDFLRDDVHIGVLNINFLNDLTILYPKSQINQKRASIISKRIQGNEIKDINLSDKLIENQLLISYINKYNLYDEDLNNLEVEISKKNNEINYYKNEVRKLNNEIDFKNTQVNGFKSKLSLKDSKIKNFESKLVNKNKKIDNLENQLKNASINVNTLTKTLKFKDVEFNELTDEFNLKELEYTNQINSLTNNFDQNKIAFNNKISSLSNELNQINQSLENTKNEYKEQISLKNSQIISLKNELTKKENNFAMKESELNNQIRSKDLDIKQKINQIRSKQNKLIDKEMKINSLEHCYTKQLSKIDNKEYCIKCFKEEISNNNLEIEYLKRNNLIKKILIPFDYLYLIFKSPPKEILLNMKLYRTLKSNKCFDIGFYLNKNKDLVESKWYKYFSLELHYVCNGFDENRSFNKKYFNRNSKKELLHYLLNFGDDYK